MTNWVVLQRFITINVMFSPNMQVRQSVNHQFMSSLMLNDAERGYIVQLKRSNVRSCVYDTNSIRDEPGII